MPVADIPCLDNVRELGQRCREDIDDSQGYEGRMRTLYMQIDNGSGNSDFLVELTFPKCRLVASRGLEDRLGNKENDKG